MDSMPQTLTIMMLPWLAHGHISPFLELAKRLSLSRTTTNIQIHFCSTPINLSSIHLDPNSFPSIHLLELDLPTLPPHFHTTKHLPPHLMPSLKHAFDHSQPSFRHLLQTLSPDILIYDFIQPWAPATAASLNIPSILFLTTGAAATSFFTHFLTREGHFPYPELSSNPESIHFLSKRIANGISDGDRFLRCMSSSSTFIAIKSFHEIEAEYIDYLSSLSNKEIIPIGPLVPDNDHNHLSEFSELEEWLEKKENSSVVFASFGSEYFMSDEEMEEISHGLEVSGVSFIWVVRFPPEEEVGRQLGRARVLMETMRGEKGMVMEGWAPQRRILAHRSVGGFLTHCGWSSVMEAMWFGVPMIALPLHLDQPLNARVVVKHGVGVEVRREGGGCGRYRGEDVAEGIRYVMVSKEGERVRRKAKEVAEKMGRNGVQGLGFLVEKMKGLVRIEKDTVIT